MHLTLGEKRLRWWSWYFMSRHLIIFLQRGWSQGGQRHDLCEGVVASIIRGAALDRPTPPRPSRQARRMHLTWPQAFSSGLSWGYPLDFYRTLCSELSTQLNRSTQPFQAKPECTFPDPKSSLWPLWEIPWTSGVPQTPMYLFGPGVLFIDSKLLSWTFPGTPSKNYHKNGFLG